VIENAGNKVSDFFTSLSFDGKLPEDISVINPYPNDEVKTVVRKFCRKFYSSPDVRILILGINPGRYGGGITGISFTDPVALEKHCGIPNQFQKITELSSRFIYNLINQYGGPVNFYNNFLLTAVCPLGFLKGKKNYNYYDSPQLLNSVSSFIEYSLMEHSKMNVRTDVVICLVKKNTFFLEQFNNRLKLFSKIITLEHPRFVQQYHSKEIDLYIDKYLSVFRGLKG
jgi:hypothetical protein